MEDDVEAILKRQRLEQGQFAPPALPLGDQIVDPAEASFGQRFPHQGLSVVEQLEKRVHPLLETEHRHERESGECGPRKVRTGDHGDPAEAVRDDEMTVRGQPLHHLSERCVQSHAMIRRTGRQLAST